MRSNRAGTGGKGRERAVATAFYRLLPPLVLAVMLIVAPLSAQQPDLSRPLPFDSSVITGRLDNGLRYYIRQNPKPAREKLYRSWFTN